MVAERLSLRPVAVVVMAKEPTPGGVKTRLQPRFTPDEAADLYRAMLADRCEQLTHLKDVRLGLALVGSSHTQTPDGIPQAFELVPQPASGGLGAGLGAAAEWAFERGMAVVLVDSDSPTLPLQHIVDAMDRLSGRAAAHPVDVVVGPCEDGGYCLIGLGRRAPELFQEMPWSTDQVVPETLARAAALGLRTHVLPTWWDVDNPADYDRLHASLWRSWWPARTAEWMRRYEIAHTEADVVDAQPGELLERPWTRVASRPVYRTPWLGIREDRVLTPEGRPSTYTIVDCGECVGVLPFVDDDTVLLVRQLRYITGDITWEMPTGGMDPGEPVEAAVQRELAEEAQVRAGRLERLPSYHTSKSVMNETAHLFVAYDLQPAPRQGDDTAFVRADEVSFQRVLEMVRSGEILDSMTIIAVLAVALRRR